MNIEDRLALLESENERLKQEEDRLAELEDENKRLRQELLAKDEYIRDILGSYVTAEVAEEITAHGSDIAVSGERRVVTMLFADLRQSTELSERMDAADYIRLLNHYLDDMIVIIDSWQGNILSFVGDAIVVVYGAPRINESAAWNATCSAVAMQRRMTAINDWNVSQGYPQIQMGIGIHTGEAMVGNIGSKVRTKYDVIGRNVNLASRIEGYTSGGQILVSNETFEAAGDLVHEREEGAMWVRPKGIRQEILLHDVIGVGSLRIPEWWNEQR